MTTIPGGRRGGGDRLLPRPPRGREGGSVASLAHRPIGSFDRHAGKCGEFLIAAAGQSGLNLGELKVSRLKLLDGGELQQLPASVEAGATPVAARGIDQPEGAVPANGSQIGQAANPPTRTAAIPPPKQPRNCRNQLRQRHPIGGCRTITHKRFITLSIDSVK